MDTILGNLLKWNKPKLVALAVGLAWWEPVDFPPPIKIVSTSQDKLQQGPAGQRPITSDLFKADIVVPTICPINSPVWP